MAKKQLTVFCNYYLGGVANFHRNILSNDKEALFDKRIIFLHWEELDFSLLPAKFGIADETVLEIRKYNTPLETAQLIHTAIKRQGVFVTNFGAELTSLHFFPQKQSVVIYVCHDELYVANAKRFSFLIDKFIAHNPHFFAELKKQLPGRAADIHYIPYGIEIADHSKSSNQLVTLNIVWLARLDKLKGIYHLPDIDDLLKKQNIEVNWTIIGDGPEKDTFRKLVSDRNNFVHHSTPDQQAVQALLKNQDIFILPSRLDGLPLAMLETMSMGIVPVMFEFNPGIKNIVTADTGFVVPLGDTTAMAEAIVQLHADRSLMEKIGQAAKAKVLAEYDIKVQAKKYFDFFLQSNPSESKGKWIPVWKMHGKEYHPLIPSFIVSLYRKFRKKFA